MKNFIFILSLLILYSNCIFIQPINEFEEIEIVNETQILSFDNIYTEQLDYYPEIIIICLNPYFNKNINSKLVISKTTKKSFTLSSDEAIVLSRNDYINEGNGEYILIFKNNVGGKITIFNSIHSNPLKNFKKLVIFNTGNNLDSNFNISMHSDILEEDIYLTIRGKYQNLTIEKIGENEKEELNFNLSTTKLNKGYSYNFTYRVVTNYLFLYISKIEIKTYDKLNYDKYYFIYSEPIYYLINLNEFNNTIKDLNFYVYPYNNDYYFRPLIGLEIAEVDENIRLDELDSIHYIEKKTLDISIITTKFNHTLIKSNFIIIKITTNFYAYSFFHIYEVSFDLSNHGKFIINPKVETLLTVICKYRFTVIIANNTNIKSLETFQQNYYDAKYIDSDYANNRKFPVVILPSENSININTFSIDLRVKYLNRDFSIQNFLFQYFKDIGSYNRIWLFYNNNNSVVKLKKHFGNPKLYYSNDLKSILTYQENISVLTPIYDEANIQGLFFLYIYPNDNTFIDILINEIENNENIDFTDDDNVLKFLKKEIKYNFKNIIEKNIRIEINHDFNKNIMIFDSNDNIVYTLNNNTPFIDIDESFNDLIIVSEDDTYITIYHNINEIFCNEPINTIEIKKENIETGIIINITNIKKITFFKYAIFYGYKNLIPSNLEKLSYRYQYLYISNDFEKFDLSEENKNLYIYIFGNISNYTVHYINTYKKNNSQIYMRLTPKKDYYLLPEENYYDVYDTFFVYDYTYVEIFICRNDIKENPMNIEIIDASGGKKIETITSDYYRYTFYNNKKMIKFDYNYEFILMSHENDNMPSSKNIDFYIPTVNETHISLLIKSIKYSEEFNFTIVIIEENEEGEEEIMNKLNNPCYFFQIFDKDYNLSSEYNNIIISTSSNKDYFILEEIDISKFNKGKNLYVKILLYAEIYKSAFYSKTEKIFIELAIFIIIYN